MNCSKTLFLALFLCGALGMTPAQQRLDEVNAETPEGQMLQQIGLEEDPAQKIALMEQFVNQHGSHQAAAWVYAQLQDRYMQANEHDKALAAGEKVVTLDPKDLDSAQTNLKAAEAKGDEGLIVKWAATTGERAKAVAASSKPEDEDEVEHWQERVAYAKDVNRYSEYALFGAAMKAQDSAAKLALVASLRERNPKSEYMPQMTAIEFNAHRQAGDTEKAVATGEAAIEANLADEDIYVFLADHYMQSKKDPDKVILYSNKAAEILDSKAKPEGMTDEAWTNKKTTLTGLSHFLAGATQFEQKKNLKEADKSLRAALPHVAANEQLKAATLFYLGLANYQMKNTKDAIAFSQQCAAIQSPFQAKARQNLKLMGR